MAAARAADRRIGGKFAWRRRDDRGTAPHPDPDTMTMSHRRSAFTLVELLAVIAIIALLMGLLIVAIGAATRAARNTEDQSRLRGLAQASNTYASSNKGLFPSPRTDTPGDWATARKSCNPSDTTRRDDSASGNAYKGWVCADEANCAGSIDANCKETMVALERGTLFPYVDSANAYVSPMDPTGRIRTYSMNAWVGVLYCDDYMPLLDKFKGGTKYPDACSLAFDTRTISRIKQPGNTLLFMPDNDGFKRTATCPGWNFNGFCINPNPESQRRWFDAPAAFQIPIKQVNLSFCDASTGAYQVRTKKLESGDVKTDPVNGFADFTGETLADLQGLRDLALPGSIK
jgi:prepilin-type N-terminal cleavage/methylation domain-containing protein